LAYVLHTKDLKLKNQDVWPWFCWGSELTGIDKRHRFDGKKKRPYGHVPVANK
jgi:hypothetical protein